MLFEHDAFTKFLRLFKFPHIIFTKLESTNYIRKIRKYVKVTHPKRRKNQTRTLTNRNLLFEHDAFTKFLRFLLKFLQIQHITLRKFRRKLQITYEHSQNMYKSLTLKDSRIKHNHSLFFVTRCFHEIFESFPQVSQIIQHITFTKKNSRCDLSVMRSDLN